MENIYVQFEGNVYQQIVGIPMDTQCAPLIAELREWLHKSKQYDLTDMFNDISRYLDHIFTIDNPEFEKHTVIGFNFVVLIFRGFLDRDL